MGVSRYAKSRAFRVLQEAGLISYVSESGRIPRVTLKSELLNGAASQLQ